jgi:hypothetical protein
MGKLIHNFNLKGIQENPIFIRLEKEEKRKIFAKLPKLHSCIYLLEKDYILILTVSKLTQKEKDYYLMELGISNNYPHKFELHKKCYHNGQS